MSERSEQAAMEAYPVREDFYRKDGVFRSKPLDLNMDKRYYFQQGYKQAEKNTIDYACYELELRLPEYLNYNGIQVERSEFIKDFHKAMEDK